MDGALSFLKRRKDRNYVNLILIYLMTYTVNIFVALIIVTFNELGEAELQDDMDKNQVQLI